MFKTTISRMKCNFILLKTLISNVVDLCLLYFKLIVNSFRKIKPFIVFFLSQQLHDLKLLLNDGNYNQKLGIKSQFSFAFHPF